MQEEQWCTITERAPVRFDDDFDDDDDDFDDDDDDEDYLTSGDSPLLSSERPSPSLPRFWR